MESNGDFQEEDIWTHHVVKRKLPTAPKVIPRAKNAISHVPQQQSSAPISIPDWSKVYNKKSSSRLFLKNGCYGGSFDDNNVVEEDEGDEDYDDGMVPPHEYVARRFARSQIAPSSMCEGVGRTLKGRDLSKVRNAILTKTGFLE
ncbi:hypothetical protein HAX54_009403 [Datura stramonium]|uniref:Senescence regulator n=1 Tax=Datura stramonium TaxID=4076 RepID=A0ABS8RW62_DATST|nr:hypothetical protein [Datura stramonium]